MLGNKTFRSRCSYLGSFTRSKVQAYGVTGIIARASGLLVDSRLGLNSKSSLPYGVINCRTFVGRRGDAMERFILRVREISESYFIISQALHRLDSSSTPNADNISSKYRSMEGLIEHFKLSTESMVLPAGLGFSVSESPKGLLSAYVVAVGGRSPYRIGIRSPVSHNLHLLSTATNGYTFADFVSTFCSLDVVLGEIDR